VSVEGNVQDPISAFSSKDWEKPAKTSGR